MKQRAAVNYSLYIKDYWMIAYGHPQLGGSSSVARIESLKLPSLPHTPRPQASPANSVSRPPNPAGESQKMKNVKINVEADIHDTDSESSRKKEEKSNDNVKLNLRFEISESSDFDFTEFTHL